MSITVRALNRTHLPSEYTPITVRADFTLLHDDLASEYEDDCREFVSPKEMYMVVDEEEQGSSVLYEVENVETDAEIEDDETRFMLQSAEKANFNSLQTVTKPVSMKPFLLEGMLRHFSEAPRGEVFPREG